MTLAAWVKRVAWKTGALDGLAGQRPWPGAAVLCYHAIRDHLEPSPTLAFAGLHVPVARFAEQMAALARLCTPIGLADLQAGLTGAARLPARAVHVSFDDGYRSVLRLALPVLEKEGIPASVHVCTSPVRDRTLFWFDAMARAAGDGAVTTLRDRGDADWAAVVRDWRQPAAADDELAPLDPDEVARLSAHPLIDIGAHTETHPPLAQISPERQQREVAGSLAWVREWTGRRSLAFAYPIGRPHRDYSADTTAILRDLGVGLALTTAPGWSSPRRPALEQPRFVITDGVDGIELAYRLAWRWRT